MYVLFAVWTSPRASFWALLLNALTNDLHDVLSLFNYILFAEDLTDFRFSKSPSDL